MRSYLVYITFVFICVFSILQYPQAARSVISGTDRISSTASAKPDETVLIGISEAYGKLPLSFEPNQGQVDEEVRFLSRGNGYTLFLTSSEAVLSLRCGSSKEKGQILSDRPKTDESKPFANEVIRLKSIGANPNPRITGLDELPGKSNYFIGNDPAKWRTDVSNYAKVKIEDVYPGIDLVYYGSQRHLEYDWIIAPGADPKVIRFTVESRADLKVDSLGNLILDEKGELRLKKPLMYQERDGDLTEIAGGYVVLDKGEVGIQVNKYDTALPLVIDPVLVYSTYLGGSGDDRWEWDSQWDSR